MTSPTQWTWVWANSGRWWRTGKPGVLQSMGSQRVGHNWATEQQQQEETVQLRRKRKKEYPENIFLCSKCICRFITYFTIKVLISDATQIWLITVSELRKLSFLTLPLKWEEPRPSSFCQWHQSSEKLPQIGLTLAHFFPDCCSQVISPKSIL